MITDQLHLLITERCWIKCPECALGIHLVNEPRDMSMESIKENAKFFQGIPSVWLTGGEPLFYPHFDTLVFMLKKLFNTPKIGIVTTGKTAEQHLDAMNLFDTIEVSQYDNSYGKDNSKEVAFLFENFGYKIRLLDRSGATPHISRNRVGKYPCARIHGPVILWMDNRLYPCCIGKGYEGMPSVVPSYDWERDIAEIRQHLPCPSCFMAEPFPLKGL